MFQSSWTITDYQTVKAMLTDPRLYVDPRQDDQRLDPRAENAVTLREPDMIDLDGDESTLLERTGSASFHPKLGYCFQTPSRGHRRATV